MAPPVLPDRVAATFRPAGIGYRPRMPASDSTPGRHSRDRRSHGEDYPGHGDADRPEDQYSAPEEPSKADEDDGDRDREDEPG